MSHSTLPVFSHPNFAQVLDAVIDQQIRSVDTVLAEIALDRIRQARLLEAERCISGNQARDRGAEEAFGD